MTAKILTRSDRLYPCGHALAKLDVVPGMVAQRRCPSCKARYEVTFVPASDHVHGMTGRDVWRAVWRVA